MTALDTPTLAVHGPAITALAALHATAPDLPTAYISLQPIISESSPPAWGLAVHLHRTTDTSGGFGGGFGDFERWRQALSIAVDAPATYYRYDDYQSLTMQGTYAGVRVELSAYIDLPDTHPYQDQRAA
ncbi:hypothetical protein AQ490_06060 [Wenjunlia vitaminophila]|uniref:Uncharacterized protein n=2 Tax=Wenjunlia vitaminophila TaxID=76728 RepID=A0A0T6LN11_WENVI|nr:hypothetical protein [Wenjunlia vitaminophila]KRV47472.1 hypothetical protein AQ490_06060 [Wenjunlia vitaminophila]